jgi:polysaccharide biosynthesis/export protein
MKNQSLRRLLAGVEIISLQVLLTLVLALVLTPPHAVRAQETATPAVAEADQKSEADLYRIGPGDVLDIRVFNRPQLSREAVRVDTRGMIRVPMIEADIQAGCRTEVELAREIAGVYLKYQRNPHVDVFIKEYNSRPVSVMGAVSKPGQFQLQRRIRLLELISLAGGPTERAGERILMAHGEQSPVCGKQESVDDIDSYDLNQLVRGDFSANPYVRPGDVITLPEAQQVFVVGNVFRPSSIALKEKITVSQAVAMAGGTMPDSKSDRVRIMRQTPGSMTKTEILVDLRAIDKRTTPDVALMANDIVDVPTSSGKRLLRGLLSAVLPSIGQFPMRVIR